MLAMCAFCATLPQLEAQIVGWAGVLFFGAALAVLLIAASRTAEPRVAIDHDGIHTGSAMGVVEWADVTGFRIDDVKGTKFLSVFVVDTRKYLERMHAVARKTAELNAYFGTSEIAISFVGLSPGLEEACDYLQEMGYHVSGASDLRR